MKHFTVEVWYVTGKYDFFKSTKLEEARAKFEQWKADVYSYHVRIA